MLFRSGRIVIAAVQIRGVRGVCVDIDPERIHESRQNAQIAGVADRIRFVEGEPQPPETMDEGLQFPDGLGVFLP